MNDLGNIQIKYFKKLSRAILSIQTEYLCECGTIQKDYFYDHAKKIKNNINARIRRIRVRNSESKGRHSIKEWEDKKIFYDNKCSYCGVSGKLTKDHVVSIVRGGSDSIDNIVPACLRCNALKGG